MQSLEFPLREVIGLFRQLLDAISCAHSKQIIHRDLKPANIILLQQDELFTAKVIDFGLSLVNDFDHRGADTAVNSFAGSTPYMAPELFHGDYLTPKCDVYSLGQMFWEILHGNPAFKGPPMQIALDKLKTDGLEITRANLPDGLGELIHSATRLDPEERISSSEFFDALSRFDNSPPSYRGLYPWFQGPDWPPDWT